MLAGVRSIFRRATTPTVAVLWVAFVGSEVRAEAASARSTSGAPAAQGPERAGLGGADRITGNDRIDLVAFTFDDGPDPYTTPRVLDALAKHHIPATFFVVTRHLVGSRAAQGRPLVVRAVAEGHLIGSHTANHARLRRPRPAVLQRELDDSVELLAHAAGTRIELFRPPYGVLGPASAQRVRDLGLTDVRWSIDQRDFQGTDGETLRRGVLADILQGRGGVVLLHDTKRVTAKAISQLLADLERANCRRLAIHQPPVIPVSLHYFVRDHGAVRSIPPEVLARTAAYRAYLAAQCAARGGATAGAAKANHPSSERASSPHRRRPNRTDGSRTFRQPSDRKVRRR
jgi:peptidoglycan/xylan/chitin deacetylase (PgdA/CDA1 family)